MSVLYEFAVLGSATNAQVEALRLCLEQYIEPFGLKFGDEISWIVRPESFHPEQLTASVVVFFGGENAPKANVEELMRKAISIIPVVSKNTKVQAEIPEALHLLNCLELGLGEMQPVALAMLECVGLLPRQRRVFLSYRRDESTQVALQLFEALSAKLFHVFLDTHRIAVAEDFQEAIWHNLCDTDVLVMLDTPTYFESRWTSAELGRALAKGIPVLRIGWPDIKASRRTETAKHIELTQEQITSDASKLADEVTERICSAVESLRVESHAVRNANLVSKLRSSVAQIGGETIGSGVHKSVLIRLPNETIVAVYPTVGIPTSITLHAASANLPDQIVAVLYDHIGMNKSWVAHLAWLDDYIKPVKCVSISEAAWIFADWESTP